MQKIRRSDTWRVKSRFCSTWTARKEKSGRTAGKDFQHENEEEAFQQQHVFFIPGSKKQGFLRQRSETSPLENLPSNVSVLFRLASLLCLGLAKFATNWPSFMKYSHDMAQGMSMPSVMFKGQLPRRPRHSRSRLHGRLRVGTRKHPGRRSVMAWWDYGYQITGIANRTSIADGNTWNHEHIANLARTLTAPEDEAYDVIRHLADYVLVWTAAPTIWQNPHISSALAPASARKAAPWT